MKRCLALLCACLAVAPLGAAWRDDAWLDPALFEAHSLEGGSGFIHVPLARSLPKGLLTGAIHRYRVKVGRGFPWGLEAGGVMELEGWRIDEAEKRQLLYARWTALDPARFGLGFSVGAESVGFEELGFRSAGNFMPLASLEPLDRLYAVAGGIPPGLPMLYLAAGYAGGTQRVSAPMAALVLSPWPGLAAIAEYEGFETHLGLRVLLSTQIKLDLSVGQIQRIDSNRPFADVLQQNVRFGISYSEVWP